MLRPVLVLVALAFAALLGAVQLASSAAYGDLAARPSLPAALHDHAPYLLRPVLGGAGAQAAAAIHNGDLATAERLTAALPDDAVRRSAVARSPLWIAAAARAPAPPRNGRNRFGA